MALDILDNDEGFEEILKTRATFSSVLNKTKLLDILRNRVDNTELLDFIIPRTRKFIDPNRPSLQLVMDLNKATAKYPELVTSTLDTDPEEYRMFLTRIVQDELTTPISDFFTSCFSYILNGTLDKVKECYKQEVMDIIGEQDILELRSRINGFFKIEEGELNSEEYGFIFSVVTSVLCNANDEILGSNEVTVEVLY